MDVEADDYSIDYGDGDLDNDDGSSGDLNHAASESFLPDIKINDNLNKKKRPLTKKKTVKKDENLFIYKDFDTSLTKVGGNVNVIAGIDKTTSMRGEDLIRDRLLTFKYKNGKVET